MRARERLARGWWLVPILVAVLFHARSLHDDFVGDARFLLRDNQLLARPPAGGVVPAFVRAITHDYFHDSSGNGIPYYRPLTTGAWLLEAQIHGTDRPEIFHVAQIVWFALATGAVALLARSLGATRTASALAATFFAVHPSTIEAVSELMARSDVTVTAGLIGAVAALHAWMRTEKRAWLALHAVAVLVAVASKETGVLLLPVEVVWFVLWRALVRRARDRSLVPVITTAVIVAGMFVARRVVLGATAHTAFDLDSVRWFVSSGAYLRALVAPPGESATHLVPPGEAHSALTLVLDGLALAVFAVLFAWRVNKRDAHGATLLLASLAWVAPVMLVADVHVPGSDQAYALADRWVVPTIGTLSALVAAWVSRWTDRRARVLLAVVTGAWCAIGFVLNAQLQGFYRDDTTMLALADQLYDAEPIAWHTTGAVCRSGLRAMIEAMSAGDAPRALGAYDAMSAACRDDRRVRFNHFAALAIGGRTMEARVAGDAIARGALDPQWAARFSQLHGIVLFDTGEPARALASLHRAAALGAHDCTLHIATAKAAQATGAFAEAAREIETATTCTSVPPQETLWFLAATAWSRAGETQRACAALTHAARDPNLTPRVAEARAALGCER